MPASMTKEEINALPTPDLIDRMDDILRKSQIERYGSVSLRLPISLVSDISNTLKFNELNKESQRKIAYTTFSYLVELEMNSVSSGFSNSMLYNSDYHETESWRSPTFRLRDGAIKQYQIVSSRIAMEIFMDVLYLFDGNDRISGGKSKLRAFRKWLCNYNNEFHYFAHVLLFAYNYDRSIRTPEIHGTPELPNKLLRLEVPSFEDNNQSLRLVNTLYGCWRPLQDILNGLRPNYMQISQSEADWLKTYISGTPNEVMQKINAMLAGI